MLLHSKSLCKNMAHAWWDASNMHPLSWGAQTEKKSGDKSQGINKRALSTLRALQLTSLQLSDSQKLF